MTLANYACTKEALEDLLLMEVYEDFPEMVSSFNDYFATPRSQLTIEDLVDITETEIEALVGVAKAPDIYIKYLKVLL